MISRKIVENKRNYEKGNHEQGQTIDISEVVEECHRNFENTSSIPQERANYDKTDNTSRRKTTILQFILTTLIFRISNRNNPQELQPTNHYECIFLHLIIRFTRSKLEEVATTQIGATE